MKTAKGLVEYCKAQLGKPYWFGTFGQTATKQLYEYNRQRLPSYYTAADFQQQIGQRVHDCAGLIKGYLWSETATSAPVYASNGVPDLSADAMRLQCTETGDISTLPDTAGVLLFFNGHVGVYIGNGQAIEARGHAYGVVQTAVKSRAWRYWGKLKYIDYTEEKPLWYDVSDCSVKYIKPNAPLVTWLKQQTVKPFALINASLYESKTVPVGTIIENRKIVHDAGNGLGVGIQGSKLGFGNPWSKTWDDYLTGYNCPVQDGKYVAPAFTDNYVFNQPLNRIGLARKDGRWFVLTSDGVTLRGFADYAIRNGFDTLVNLDGGGSRYLHYNGKTVYTSTRTPYNALAFYKEMPEDVCPYTEPSVNLRYGSKGDGVKWLQWHLVKLGYDIGKYGIDGDFGASTQKAVLQFQKDHKLTPDAICGAKTRKALKGE